VIIRAENINSFTEFSVGGIFAPYTNHPNISIFIENGTNIPLLRLLHRHVLLSASPLPQMNWQQE
jgi:hypothetical protein